MSTLSISPYFPFSRVKLVNQAFFDEKNSVIIWVEPDLRFDPLCHCCGNKALGIHSHDHHRAVRDLNLGATKTWLDVGYRKVVCAACDTIRVEYLSFCDAGRRITHRLAEYIYGLCKVMTVEEVAKHLNLDSKTVKAVDYTCLQEEFGGTDYSHLRVLAIDEIAVKKGHRYMTVVLDYLTGRVVWMGEGRTMETLDGFFKLDDLRNLNETINRVYLLNDQLKTLYWYTNREYAEQALENWCVMADRIDHPAVKKFAGRLRFFKKGILNQCDCPIDTGKLEGVNNKIKLIKRRAFGYHDPDYFALKVKQAFPGRPAAPKHKT